jgi:hypothetical protein
MSVPSLYKEFLDAGGTGVHHICYWADLDRSLAHFGAAGAELVQRGTTPNGVGFMYVSGSCGIPYIEVVDPNDDMMRRFTMIADAAEFWDGTDPLQGWAS